MKTTERTPLPDHVVHVWRFSLISARQEITTLRHWLSERENEALKRMVSPVERDRRIVAWGRLRYILSRYLAVSPGDIRIQRESTSRPEIVSPEEAGTRFSLTHSGNHGLLAVSRMTVGIDLETIRSSIDAKALSVREGSFGAFLHTKRIRVDRQYASG